jgi:hypothetical protein
VGGPIDYCLELNPAADDGGRTRPLPGLYHGSMTVLRSRDKSKLAEALLRILGSHDHPAGPGQVRLGLMPVVRDGVALLAPPATIAAVPDRWITAQRIDVVYTLSSLVDVGAKSVLVDPPLGTVKEPEVLTFGGWWLPPTAFESARSPGFAVAEVMKLAIDLTPANAGSALRTVATLVERNHPDVAPETPAGIKESLVDALTRITQS